MNEKLKNAIKNTLNSKNITGPADPFTYNNGAKGWRLEANSSQNHDDYITMLNYLPNLMNDTEKLSDIVISLVGIIIQQQQEMIELKNLVKNAILNKTTVTVQDNFNQQIEKLVDKNRDIENAEIQAEIHAEIDNQSEEDYSFEEHNKEFNYHSKQVSGGLKGLLSILASLEFSSQSEDAYLNDSMKKMDEKINTSQKSKFEGKLIAKIGKITKSKG